MRFRIQPLKVEKEALEEAVKVLREAFHSEVQVLEELKLPSEAYNPRRGQYNASLVMNWLASILPVSRESLIIGLCSSDAYVTGLNFIFGLASPFLGICIVFTARLHQSFYGLPEDERIFRKRVRKEVLHEVGHLLGLEHCSIPECVMRFSNSILDTDYKRDKYCMRCYEKMLSKGIKVDLKYVL